MGWHSWGWSPDYFHPCSDDIEGFAGVPSNAFGYQFPISGEAYAGLATYEDFTPQAREYIAIELSEPLTIGQSYYVFFHASLYDGGMEAWAWCATNHIGLRFFKNPEYHYQPSSDWLMPDNFAHIDYSEILTDTTHWTKIEGWVTADQEYNWLAIGNFFDDDNTDILILNESEVSCWGYYYIENICVSPTPSGCDYLLSASPLDMEKGYAVYPNPAKDYVNIDLKNKSIRIESAALYDMTGRLVTKATNVDSPSLRIDTGYLSSGVYVLRIKANSTITNHKIYKK